MVVGKPAVLARPVGEARAQRRAVYAGQLNHRVRPLGRAKTPVYTGKAVCVKGGDKVYHRGVEVQGKCPGKCSAKMSLG